MVFDCCPGVYDPTSDACVSEEVGGDLCDEDDEGCNEPTVSGNK